MEPLHTLLRLSILLLALTCSMGVTAQTSKAAQNDSLPNLNIQTPPNNDYTEKQIIMKKRVISLIMVL